jgi:hypothetical protein
MQCLGAGQGAAHPHLGYALAIFQNLISKSSDEDR